MHTEIMIFVVLMYSSSVYHGTSLPITSFVTRNVYLSDINYNSVCRSYSHSTMRIVYRTHICLSTRHFYVYKSYWHSVAQLSFTISQVVALLVMQSVVASSEAVLHKSGHTC